MMDAQERELFAATLGRVVASAEDGGGLDDALEELGWAEALALDERTAVATLFEQQGRAAATSSALGRVVVTSLGVDLDALASAPIVLLPALGGSATPGRAAGGCVPVRGLALGDARRHDDALVIATREGAVYTGVVPLADLGPQPVDGLDPALELVQVDVGCAKARSGWDPVAGQWDDAVAAAQRAVAHELVGTMRTMLDLARQHAVERVQFDRPIAGFQAVRHRLAETLVAVEAADAALDAAWLDGTPAGAHVAKAVAGQSARTVRRHCQQVLAGIGFTTEHDLHRYVRRSIVLDGLFGDSRRLTADIGSDLLAAGRLPAITPL
jgi:Acyl-CoA dehydrogenase, C-terminal domain